jgi:anthranilate/para-aminobenzoate synthase component I
MNHPLIQALDGHELAPIELFARLPSTVKNLAFLASDGSPDSRWSILAWDAVKTIRCSDLNDAEELTNEIQSRQTNLCHSDRGGSTTSGGIPFLGGGIGTIDYEGAVEWSFYDAALVYDHHAKQWWGINVEIPTSLFVIPTEAEGSLTQNNKPLRLTPSWGFQTYQKAFDVIHDNIRRGEIYQACLTFPFTGPGVKNPRALFAQLFAKNPAPMAAYLEQSDRTVMSFSPERFLEWNGSKLQTKPIKGTRPRGKTPAEDEQMKNELLADAKEQAELTMITDLLRNDLAKVSKAGTVQVIENHALQATPNVWHTYTHIRSETREGIEAWDIVQSMFPGGSISGCPKKRAIELLKEVEPEFRGIYTGCIGTISDHGCMDMSIAIRTLEQKNGILKAGFGSGIVYDSRAQTEYDECFAKAKFFLSS